MLLFAFFLWTIAFWTSAFGTASTNVQPINNEVKEFVPPESRVTCTPDITQDTNGTFCSSRGCIFDSASSFPTPSCYFPRKSGYVATSVTPKNGMTVVKLEEYKKFKNPFQDNYQQLTLTAKSIQKTTLNIRIAPDEKRYEPNLDIPKESVETGESFIVETSNGTSVFSFKVIRKSTKQVIWDTSIGGLMFADQYIQIAAYINSSNVYGLGENYDVRLRHILQGYQTWAMFARDETIPKWAFLLFNTYGKKNLYGAYPFYMAIERDGKTHGVLFLNSNAQEVTLGPHPQIIYRTIGGILDVYFFPGPKPEDVIRQYLAYVGRPALPPYWALGQQVSRPGLSLEQLSSFVKENMSQSVVHLDIDYMKDYQEFTLAQAWQNLSTFIEQLHRKDIHAVIKVGPALAVTGEAFLRARNARADFFEWQNLKDVPTSVQNLYNSTKNTKIMLGVSWPNVHVAFPNYDSPETMRWWSREIQRFQEQLGFDGIQLTMNEPTSFDTNLKNASYGGMTGHAQIAPLMCPLKGSSSAVPLEVPPYQTYSVYLYDTQNVTSYLSSKTLCMSAVSKSGRIYDVKNLYGLKQTIATQKAMISATKKRSFVISRSMFPSGGRYAAHALGYTPYSFSAMARSVTAIQEFNMFGIPFVGADICGSVEGNWSDELNNRWLQLGLLYPLSLIRKDQYSMPTIDPNVNLIFSFFRKRISPYMYTLFFEAARSGGTVIRPLFFEFPNDDAAHLTYQQFMLGPALLFTPVLSMGANETYAYFPRDASWYFLSGSNANAEDLFGREVESGYRFVHSDQTWQPSSYIRGGTAVPAMYQYFGTDVYDLQIAIEDGKSSGKLIVDDGESIIDFNANDYYELDINFIMNATHSKLELNLVHKKPGLKVAPITGFNFFGYNETPLGKTMTKNGARFNPMLDYYFAERRYYAVNAEPTDPLFDFTTDVVFAWENKKTSPTTTSSSETTETTTASETFGSETSPETTSSSETTETTTASETFGSETSPETTGSSETTETTTASESFGSESTPSLPSTSSSTPNATTTSNVATSFNYIDAKHSFITLLALNTLFWMLY